MYVSTYLSVLPVKFRATTVMNLGKIRDPIYKRPVRNEFLPVQGIRPHYHVLLVTRLPVISFDFSKSPGIAAYLWVTDTNRSANASVLKVQDEVGLLRAPPDLERGPTCRRNRCKSGANVFYIDLEQVVDRIGPDPHTAPSGFVRGVAICFLKMLF